MKKNITICSLIIALAFSFCISCDLFSSDSNSSTSKGFSVTEEEWEKAFKGASASKGTSEENIQKYGFDSGTVKIINKITENGKITDNQSETLYFGDGFVCDSLGTAYLAYSEGNRKWYTRSPMFEQYGLSKNSWYLLEEVNGLSDDNSSVGVDSCFFDVESKGSAASLAYICAWRNYLGYDGIDLSSCYNEKYFDETEGAYKFGLKNEPVINSNGEYAGSRYVLYPYSEGDEKITVKFDANGLLTNVTCKSLYEFSDPDYGINSKTETYLSFSFTNYNKTKKPSFFPALSI